MQNAEERLKELKNKFQNEISYTFPKGKIKFADIIGNNEAKQKLFNAMILPILNHDDPTEEVNLYYGSYLFYFMETF